MRLTAQSGIHINAKGLQSLSLSEPKKNTGSSENMALAPPPQTMDPVMPGPQGFCPSAGQGLHQRCG